jgi:hypothetical protein
VSFHLDYGPGVLFIALWAAASVLAYLRLRRVLPFILAHAIWDLSVLASDLLPISHLDLFAYGLAALWFLALGLTWRQERTAVTADQAADPEPPAA